MRTVLGYSILKIQAEKDISNAELAKRMGMAPQAVSKLKTRRTLQPKTIHRLAKALGVDVDFILVSIR
jgi:DNA-binding Xre family transcriptional regulator